MLNFGIVLGFIVLLASYTEPVTLDKNYSKVDVCLMYDESLENLNSRLRAVLNDEVEYLSWQEFTYLQSGGRLPDLEEYCKNEQQQ